MKPVARGLPNPPMDQVVASLPKPEPEKPKLSTPVHPHRSKALKLVEKVAEAEKNLSK